METVEEEQPLRRATGCHHGRQPFFSPLASEPWNQDPGPARDGVLIASKASSTVYSRASVS
jgi:hypothetical protein